MRKRDSSASRESPGILLRAAHQCDERLRRAADEDDAKLVDNATELQIYELCGLANIVDDS